MQTCQVGAGGLVHGKEPRLAARLDGHVRHREPPGHREAIHHRPGELDGLVQRPADANLPDGVENQVFAADPGLQLAVVDDADRLRHAHPDAPRRHRHGDVGAALPGGEGPQCAVGTRVRVGTHDDVARHHQTLLREQDVLDTHAAHVKVVEQPLRPRKSAHTRTLLGRFDVLVGREMVGHHHHAVGVEHPLHAQLLELADGDGRGDVVRQHHVHRHLHQVTRPYLGVISLAACYMGSNDLLGQGMSHRVTPFAAQTDRTRPTSTPSHGALRTSPAPH